MARFFLRTVSVTLIILAFSITATFGQLQQEAYQQAQNFYSKMYRRCGDYYYYKYIERMAFLYQCRYAPTITIEGKENQPRTLSEADILNGVDPLPVVWEGVGSINFRVCRRQAYYVKDEPGVDSWDRWQDTYRDSVRMQKAKGAWTISNQVVKEVFGNEKVVMPIDCEEVPGANHVAKATPPSWVETGENTFVLTLPAAYDKWYYVGTGPITMKPVNPYSTVYVDGGTRHETIYEREESTYWPRRTNPEALAPDVSLGAIVVKYGTNGSPFAAFEDHPGRTMEDLVTPANDEIFVAVNDSYFGDNRGAHQVVISGPHLCMGCEHRIRRTLQ